MKTPTYDPTRVEDGINQLSSTIFRKPKNVLALKRAIRIHLSAIIMLFGMLGYAQLPVPFSPRLDGGSIKVKGDIVFIGNSIVTGVGLPQPYNGNGINNNNEGVYINVASGGDPNIFSSSSADLLTDNSCKQILYAGLYWASVYPLEVANNQSVQFEGTPRLEDWNQIKFKLPGGNFIDLVADNDPDPAGEEDDIIFDGYEYYGAGVENSFKDSPIICYKNVTNLLQGLTEADGEYTVANLRATRGRRKGGCSAGWTLVVIYESPILPSKYIALFDGYAGVQNTTELDIPVSGFQTLPAPYPVNASIGVGALEGDIGITGDSFQFKASTSTNFTVISDAINQANNFFNSSVTRNGVHNLNRNPASTNTLGMDINNVDIPNPSNIVLPNDATAGDLKLTTNGDGYGAFVTSFSVEVIEPNIVLTKVVEDEFGNNIGGQVVDLGQDLSYVIGFQNTGNDDAINFTIRDILPVNTILDYPSGLDLPPGVTVQSYDPVTRELVFEIDDEIVEEFDPYVEFRINVQVVETCQQLIDACTNLIQNQAFATYSSETNPSFLISDDPSFSSNTGCLLSPQTTNFLADLDDCTSSEEVVLCGTEVTLTAGNGYDSHSWSTSPTGTPVIGTGQSITVTESGTYYVDNIAIAPCQSTAQVFEVTIFGAGVSNPLIPFADEVVVCPNDGKELPNFYLCGVNDVRSILTGITDTTSIIWEQLDESSCAAVANPDCANEDESCTWNEVGTGSDYSINTAGQFRLTLNYEGGCFNQFYFNVYQNVLDPNVTSRDIYCDTSGEITVGGVPSGYEFSIDGTNFQTSPVFTINTPGLYTVYIRQVGVNSNPCIFSVPDVLIRDRDFTISTIIEQPFCNNDLGSVYVAANDVRPQYFFSIYQGATLVNSVGPITENNYTFQNLNPGNYTVNVSTEDGCDMSEDIEIIQPPILEVTAAITQPLNCTDGEITIYATGGTEPYFYFINGSSDFQTIPTIAVTTAGTYQITVVDANNCSAETTISIDGVLPPEFMVNKTDDDCIGGNGSISIDVINANGNALMFSIDGGTTFLNTPVFNNLIAGDYDVVVQYSFAGNICASDSELVTINSPGLLTADVDLSSSFSCVSPGEITVNNVSGGVPPFTYSIDGVNFQAGNTFSGLDPGTYNIWVQDASGCAQGVGNLTIDPLDPPIDMEFLNSSYECPANTITLSIDNIVGGVPPLEYQIISPATYSTGYQSATTFSGLEPGTYTIQVRDANECTYSETYVIPQLPALDVTAQLSKNLDCSASPDAEITGTISGGVTPFSYAVSFNGGAYSNLGTSGPTFNYAASQDGTYVFEITDANGCTTQTEVVNVTAIEPVTISLDAQDPNCNGDANGTIQLDALTGTAPFVFSLDGGVTFTSNSLFGGLTAGTYNYVVRDANECEVSGTISLNDPLPIVADITANPIQCNSNIPGSIDVSVTSGGITPFNYTIYDPSFNVLDTSNNNSNTNHTFNGLDFGDYYIGIVDINGCEFISNLIRIETPPNISLTGNASSGSCITGATIDLEVVSGVAPFTYSIFGQPATAVGPTASTTQSFTGLDHGVTYQFQVIDAGGCFSILEVTTPILSAIDVSANTTSDVSCFGGTDGGLDFTVSNYDPSVTTISYEVVDALTNVPIVPAVSGNITGLSGAPASGSISGLAAGSYTLMIREANGTFCTTALPFGIRQPAQSLLAAIGTVLDANCLNDAQLTINASGGTPPYSYAVGLPGFIPLTGDFDLSNVVLLDPAISTDWDIVVLDSNGCEIRLNQTILVDPEPEIALSTLNSCSIEEGTYQVEVSLVNIGTGPYSLSIDGGAFQSATLPFTAQNLSSGSHTFKVRDSNGCTNLQSINIEAPLSIVPDVTTRTSCNNDDGVISFTAVGGSGNFDYTILPSAPSIAIVANTFTGVPSGVYTISINDLTTGCNSSVDVVMPTAIEPTITMTPTGVNCFAGNDGSFELLVDNYTGNYTYEIYDSSNNLVEGPVAVNTVTNPQIVTGLESGSFNVIINSTESPFCSTSGLVIITSPQEALDLNLELVSNVTCDDTDGTIVATVTGGTAGYEYELTGTINVPYSTNGTFSGLGAGTYTINVRDAQGCIDTENIILDPPPAISADIDINTNPLFCFGDNNATIEVTNVSGGQGDNYSYTLNTLLPVQTSFGPQTSPVFSNLAAGTYQIIVSDALNCVYQPADIVISEPDQLQASLVVTTTQTCSVDTSLTLSAIGGTGNYEYSPDENFSNILGTFTSSVSFDVAPGTYQYYVRDANGCISAVSNEIFVDELTPLEVVLNTTNSRINCFGDATGSVTAVAQGGLGNYQYTLQDAQGNDLSIGVELSPGVYTELPAGVYQIYVTSGDCDAISLPVNIEEPQVALTADLDVSNVSCSGLNDGTITVQVNGGTGVIKYAISPQLDQFFDDPVFENLTPGDYQVLVQDELGCFELIDVTIEEPAPVILSIVADSIFPEVCSGDQNGEFSIEISGGTLPYNVSLDNPDGPFTTGSNTQTEFDFTDLEGGDHIVYVRDSSGCFSEWNITFPPSVRLNPLVEIEYNCDENTPGNTVTVIIEDETIDLGDLDYSLNGGPYQANATFKDVPPGPEQFIEVRHTNGCIQMTETFNIDEIAPLELVLEEGEINEIIAIVGGGSEIYEYFLNGESYGSTNTFLVYESGVYTVSVRDSYGCEVSATISIEYVDVCIPNYFTPNGDGVQDGWGPGCATQYQNLEFDIFDRYGRKVASLNVDQKWDGTYEGRELPTGDYWYVVRLNDVNDDRDFVGHFTLYR